MSADRIGGVLDLDALSRLHAPRTPDEVQSAVRRLAQQKFSDTTIAEIMRLDVNSVRQLLGPSSTEPLRGAGGS